MGKMEEEKTRVCVTGVGGYVASWLVKSLLSKDYIVHGTVRNPSDEKNEHLKILHNASNNLRLFKAELLDYDALSAAIEGCCGVFHVSCATPSIYAPSSQEEMIETAVTGTRNVLNASSKAKLKKIVLVSTIGSVVVNLNWPADQLTDEDCWSDLKACRSIEHWYSLAKTMAEREAFEYAKRSGVSVVSICPAIAIGPLLQSPMNASSSYFLKFLKGGSEAAAESGARALVDVRDVGEALVLVYENQKAEGRRYICSSHVVRTQDLVEKLKIMYPSYNYTTRFMVENGMRLSSEKLKELGWKCRPLEETLVDAVNNFQHREIWVVINRFYLIFDSVLFHV